MLPDVTRYTHSISCVTLSSTMTMSTYCITIMFLLLAVTKINNSSDK